MTVHHSSVVPELAAEGNEPNKGSKERVETDCGTDAVQGYHHIHCERCGGRGEGRGGVRARVCTCHVCV